MRKETPAPWLKLMEAQGITSLRGLAEKAGVAHTVTSRMVHGTGTPKDESIVAVSKALRVPAATIYGLAMMSVPTESGPWQPPAEAARLTTSQRDALAQLIRTMVNPGTPEELERAAEAGHQTEHYAEIANMSMDDGDSSTTVGVKVETL